MRLSNTHLLSAAHPSHVPVGRICHLSFSPSGGRAFVSLLDKPAEDSVLSIWDLSREPQPTQVLSPVQHGFVIRSGWISEDRLWSATRRCGEGYAELRFQSLATSQGDGVESVLDGRLLWMHDTLHTAWLIDREGCINYVDLRSQETLHHIPTHLFASKRWDPFIPMPALSPDASFIAAIQDEQTIRVLNLPDGSLRSTFDVDDDVSSMVLFAAHNQLATASFDGAVRLWDITTGARITTLIGESDVTSLARLPNHRIFVSYIDAPPKIWDLTTFESISCEVPPEFDGHQGITTRTHLHPDQNHLLTVHQNHLLHAWNLTTGALTTVYEAPEPITALATHPDGRILIGDIIGRVSMLQSTPF